ncbi:hypothetical protein BHE74_00036365 [Ensete ventricosum]|nr:hypothetical protein BHE74_00036365 [Ensete ventricosum]RZS05953.1 hypothetical protein BHM03_00036537 [Ensete ventricosum]
MSLLLLTKPISVSCFARDTTSHSRSPRRPPPRRCTTSTIVPSAARSAASAAKPSSSILSSLAIYGCRTSLSVTDHWRNSHSPAIPATVANRAVAFLLCHLIAAAAAPPFPVVPSSAASISHYKLAFLLQPFLLSLLLLSPCNCPPVHTLVHWLLPSAPSCQQPLPSASSSVAGASPLQAAFIG